MSRRHKYKAQAVVCPDTGERFDSKSEYRRWRELKLLQMAGEIRNLRRQVRYPLAMTDGTPIKIRSKGYPNGRQAVYVADFVYEEWRGGTGGVVIADKWQTVVEDRKGFDTPKAKLARGVWEAQHKREIRIS